MSPSQRPAWIRYSIALASVLAISVGVSLHPQGTGGLLLFGILLSAWFGGLGPGVFATLVLVGLFTLDAVQKDQLGTVSKLTEVAVFFVLGAAVSTLIEAMHAARRAAEQSATDAERHQEALRQADRHKDEFLATLAHELRNPLAAIDGAVKVLGVSDQAEDRLWAADVIGRQERMLVRLVEDLLDVSRIARGKVQLHKELADLRQLVDRTVDLVHPQFHERGHELIVVRAEQPLLLEADCMRLEQVLINLLMNAAKYTEHGGRITVSARHEGPELVLSVRDNGTGIAPEMLPHVFDMFTQAESTRELSQGGLGIGLTLVRRLVELHGGRVAAASEGTGRGSEFLVWLPAAPSALLVDRRVGPKPDVEVGVTREPVSVQGAHNAPVGENARGSHEQSHHHRPPDPRADGDGVAID
jgi:signal transduction histidine kinase